MRLKEFVTDKNDFLLLSGECEKIINTEKRLPNFVFRRPFARYFAIEHSQVYSEKFGVFLSNVSRIFGDETVNYMTLDPHPVDYYYKRLSFFGLASFTPSSLVEKYSHVMSRDGNVDSFKFRGGDVGAFWGSSLEWGISCDRISWEMAVIAVPEKIDVPTLSGFSCMSALEVSSYIKSQYDWKPSAALDFTEKFLLNYAI